MLPICGEAQAFLVSFIPFMVLQKYMFHVIFVAFSLAPGPTDLVPLCEPIVSSKFCIFKLYIYSHSLYIYTFLNHFP